MDQRIITSTSIQSVSGLQQDVDENGEVFLPRFTAKMEITVPAEMSPLDIKAVWTRFSEDLKKAIGYTAEVEAYENPFERFKQKSEE